MIKLADVENEFEMGYVDTRRHNKGQETGATNKGFAAQTGLSQDRVSVAALRSFLSTANAAYYTTARLNQMTKNDMMYANRQQVDAAGIK